MQLSIEGGVGHQPIFTDVARSHFSTLVQGRRQPLLPGPESACLAYSSRPKLLAAADEM
jgi:hypothetical protein